MITGNRTGWIIAATIVLVEIAAIGYALSLDRYTRPTALVTPAQLAPLVVPAEPDFLWSPAGSANATALYRTAITEYLANVGEYESAMRDNDRARIGTLPALDKLLAARNARGDALFADHLSEIIVYGDPTALQAITQLGQACLKAGALYEKREPDRAARYYEAAFALGRRMVRERLTWREYHSGVTLMSTAGAARAAQLARKPETAPQSATIQAFLDAQRVQYESNQNIFAALYTHNETKIATHAGDVFAFATDSQETMWRVEATLKLGRMRFNPGNPPLTGNQRHAARLLRDLLQSTDPVIRGAAEEASQLTIEQFRTLR